MEKYNLSLQFYKILRGDIGAQRVRRENNVKINTFLKGETNENCKNVNNFGCGFGADGLLA